MNVDFIHHDFWSQNDWWGVGIGGGGGGGGCKILHQRYR